MATFWSPDLFTVPLRLDVDFRFRSLEFHSQPPPGFPFYSVYRPLQNFLAIDKVIPLTTPDHLSRIREADSARRPVRIRTILTGRPNLKIECGLGIVSRTIVAVPGSDRLVKTVIIIAAILVIVAIVVCLVTARDIQRLKYDACRDRRSRRLRGFARSRLRKRNSRAIAQKAML